jgi:outer membrane protein OmpA-like peptidoglycan-associated protein
VIRSSYALFAVSVILTVAVLSSSCAPIPPSGATTVDEPVRQSIAPRKIVQIGFGRDAVFASCVEPACPEITRKTLTVLQDSVTAPIATRALGEEYETARPQAFATTSAQEERLFAPVAGAQRLAFVIQFPFGGATLAAADKAALDELIPLASKAERITIAGRTDNGGSESANHAVALARANAVRDYLGAKLSVPDEALIIDAQGSCCYVASNDTPEGRRQNRRVEIVLSVPEQVAQ